MFKSVAHIAVIMCMFVAFLGQTFTYSAMSCNMVVDAHLHNSSMNEVFMGGQIEHGAMTHAASTDNMMHHAMMADSSTEDCCADECACPASACTSVSLVNTQPYTVPTDASVSAIMSTESFLLNSHRKSLYRPPILA